jgi:hypothetical protein
MPRQIIDTESSRPAYQRRIAIQWIVIAVLVLGVALAGYHFLQATHP